MTSVTVFDGAESIGGNKIFVEDKGEGVFLDFGKNFGKYGMYYEEFLKNRTTRGLHDLISLDLIPKLNIYRDDLVPSDVDLSRYPALRVHAVLLSHAHVDHFGNIGLLDQSIPLVASPLSLAILKGMQDTGNSAIDTDAVYSSPRSPDQTGRLLHSESGQPHKGRNLYCTASPSHNLVSFLSTRPGQDRRKAKKYKPGSCRNLDNVALPFKVTAFDVDHSIPGACAYLLEADQIIAYTGDFRLHGRQEAQTRTFMHHAKDASVLIIEGTRTSRHSGPEEDGPGKKPATEESVCETCRAAVENAKGLVIADFSARNFERLDSFSGIAEKTGRTLVITAKDAYMLHALECADGVCRTGQAVIYEELISKTRIWETEVVAREPDTQYVSHETIRNDPESYLLCFSFFDMNHLLDINPSGGTYLYSACEAFNEEMVIDFRRLWQWLRRFGIQCGGFEMDEKYTPVFDQAYHASGHASPDDLAWVIDQVDPDVLIPVHTTNPGWFSERSENVHALLNGDILVL